MVGYTADDNTHQERWNEQKKCANGNKNNHKNQNSTHYMAIISIPNRPSIYLVAGCHCFVRFVYSMWTCRYFFLLSLAWMNVMTWRASWWSCRCALHTAKLASVSKQLKEIGLCNKLTVSRLVFFFCSFGRPNPFENFPHNNFIHWHSLECRSIVN